jgi:putative ABC transport system permease protein
MLSNYLKITCRNLLKFRLYSAVNLIGLAVGIAGSILILIYVYYEYSFDRFNEYADHIYRINQYSLQEGVAPQYVGLTMSPLASALVQDIGEIRGITRVRIFDIKSLFRYEDRSFYISNVAFVDSTIFDIFSFPLIEGDPSSALTRPNSIVLGEEMAKKLFGEVSPLGNTVTWGNGMTLEVTGVMRKIPANSHLILNALVSFDVAERLWSWMDNWSLACLATYVRLADGASPGNFNLKVQQILENHLPSEDAEATHLYLQPLTKIHLGSPNIIYQYNHNPGNLANVRILTAIAIFILLLACINYTNLTTARTVRRSMEVGIRKVIGAKRGDLILQFLLESMTITLLATVLAMVLVELLLPVFRAIIGRDLSLEILLQPSTWIAFVGGVFFIGLISGVYPALYLSRYQPAYVFRALRWSGSHGARLRSALIVLQFTISAALIVCTLIVLKQLHFWHSMDLGFNRDRTIIVPLNSRETRSQTEILKAKLLENPSISHVSAISNIPGEAFPQMSVEYEGMSEGQEWTSAVLTVDYDYLETLGAKLIQGRNFSRVIGTDSATAFIVSETAARQLGWSDPIGKEMYLPFFERRGTVIGVIRDFHYQSLHYAIEPLLVVMEPRFYGKLLVRYDSQDVSEVLDTMQNAWEELIPIYPFEYSFMDADLDHLYSSERKTAELLMIFAGLSIFIACLGLFGLAAFVADQKTKEIGIRKTLGASVVSIVMLLTRSFALSVIMANLIAYPIAYFVMTSWLQDFAYRINPDLSSFALAAIIALCIAFITVGFQAVKAALANPVDSLRYE